ncbi:MAG: hypothetical protein SXU28_12715 [Pseudomonadota bacterium]|nr:hypothetical protein [Pseudomonadota bacterium]
MNAADEKRRLSQARRIAEVKERRSERARIEAVHAETEATRRLELAANDRSAASRQKEQARSVFFQNSGDPQAEVWLIANEMREEQAVSAARIAEEKCLTARDNAQAARREHDRMRERSTLIETRIDTVARKIKTRESDREDEEMQGSRS